MSRTRSSRGGRASGGRPSRKGWGKWLVLGGVFVESELVHSRGERVFEAAVEGPTVWDAMRKLKKRFKGCMVKVWERRCVREPVQHTPRA